MEFNRQKRLRATRLVLTCLILFMLTWYYQVPESAWCLITVWFVMFEYTNIGGVYKKGFYRFAGTTLSAIYGLIIIYFFANNVLINMLAFVAGVYFYAYYFLDTEKSYIAIIGAVTLTIVLLNHNNTDAAIYRAMNIIVGILASIFMTRFFYPRYASDDLIDAQIHLIEQLIQALNSYLDQTIPLHIVQENYLKLEGNLIKKFSLIDRNASETKVETRKHPEFVTCNLKATEHIRRLFRLISVLINYFTNDDIRSNASIQHPLKQVIIHLQTIIHELKGNEIFNTHITPVKRHKAPFDQNILFVRMMISKIQSEIYFLDDEIKKIRLIKPSLTV